MLLDRLGDSFAILAGFASWTVLWLTSNQLLFRLFRSKFDDAMMTRATGVLALILVLSILISILAGWLTAKVARRAPIAHTVARDRASATQG